MRQDLNVCASIINCRYFCDIIHGVYLYYSLLQIKDVPAGGALLDSVRSLDFLPGFNLEGFPNRDSTAYSNVYGIDKVNTILRGTIRYTLLIYKQFSFGKRLTLQMGKNQLV